jgi:hypothetical protein
MTVVTTQMADARLDERRRRRRVGLTLSGRYLLGERDEQPCRAFDVSPGGIAVLSMEKGFVGERLVAYFDHIGRVQGTIVRTFDSCFAVTMQLPARKIERLTRPLGWLVNRHARGAPDNRLHERVKLDRRRTTLTTMDGREFDARLIDASIAGAALHVDAAPPIGARVVIGRAPARVVRHFPAGLAVKFEELLPPEIVEAVSEA